MTFLSTEPKFSDSDNVLLGKILQQLIAGGGGGSGSQTPWASAINGGGFNLSNVATITATSFVGALTGNASTATVLQTARTINGVSFNGSADITLPAGNQTPWASDIDGASFDLNNVTSIVATEVAANNFAVLDSGGGLGVLLQFAGATFSISDAILDPKLTYNGATWDFVGIVESDSMQVNGVIQATNRLTITQGNANTAVFASTGYSLTGSNATSLIDLAGTWNTSGNPVALKLAISNTASGATSKFLSFLAGAAGATEVFSVDKSGAVSALAANTPGAVGYGFIGDVNTGIYRIGVGRIGIATAGVQFAEIGNGSFYLAAANGFGWQASAGNPLDVALFRDAANTLALRNGVNAQAFRVYNTFTDASNYERLSVVWASNVATIQTANAGTGVVRNLQLGTGNTSGVKLWTDNTIDFQTSSLTTRWTINPSGHILAGADNSYDIGASGATRPRTIYAATSLVSGGQVRVGSNNSLVFETRGQVFPPSDGVLTLYNIAGDNFSRLQFGGTTDSFGAIGRDGAGIKIVGAAGGSTAWIKVPGVTVANLPAAGTAGDGARAYVTDAASQVFGATVTGGGAVPSPVYSDGTVWRTG